MRPGLDPHTSCELAEDEALLKDATPSGPTDMKRGSTLHFSGLQFDNTLSKKHIHNLSCLHQPLKGTAPPISRSPGKPGAIASYGEYRFVTGAVCGLLSLSTIGALLHFKSQPGCQAPHANKKNRECVSSKTRYQIANRRKEDVHPSCTALDIRARETRSIRTIRGGAHKTKHIKLAAGRHSVISRRGVVIFEPR